MCRHSNGVSLTSEGEAIAASLHEACETIAQSYQRVRATSEKAHVFILSSMATMQMWLMPRLSSFWAAHQNIVVEHTISERRHDLGAQRHRFAPALWRWRLAG